MTIVESFVFTVRVGVESPLPESESPRLVKAKRTIQSVSDHRLLLMTSCEIFDLKLQLLPRIQHQLSQIIKKCNSALIDVKHPSVCADVPLKPPHHRRRTREEDEEQLPEERRPNSCFNPPALSGRRTHCSRAANQHPAPTNKLFDGLSADSGLTSVCPADTQHMPTLQHSVYLVGGVTLLDAEKCF
ncbi:unnamed protein product [Pleuronectes platessa]|uniref:Uncharacterized protein n=1 Tax=Pleuronectes platessa TaxID=8262 RepID=A0A9N7ZCC5_PLEPL|nr:unnamed protein product [Pleuronectes platessa]